MERVRALNQSGPKRRKAAQGAAPVYGEAAGAASRAVQFQRDGYASVVVRSPCQLLGGPGVGGGGDRLRVGSWRAGASRRTPEPEGKPARLTQRAEQVRALVERAGAQVLPMIITSSPDAAIAQNELDAAKADGIRVLSQDDLAVLLGMAMRRAPVRHVAQ